MTREQQEIRARYEATRTHEVRVGLELVQRLGGSMDPREDGQPCKIAHLVAFATLGGAHEVQAQFDRFMEASDDPNLVL